MLVVRARFRWCECDPCWCDWDHGWCDPDPAAARV